MLEYGRATGGVALRRLTFHQRARMLKALAIHLTERKEEFYRVSRFTGATRGDSWIDIDGGIGTLFAYASRGRRDFPDETYYVDGRSEEHTSELQSQSNLVCRLLLEKKKKKQHRTYIHRL